MTDTTQKPSRELTMKDFFREENGEVIPVDESVLIDFKDGDIVEGEVVRIDRDEVLVDIGYKSEGLVPSNELTIRRARTRTTSSSWASAWRPWSCRRGRRRAPHPLRQAGRFRAGLEPHRGCLQRPAHRRGTRDRGG